MSQPLRARKEQCVAKMPTTHHQNNKQSTISITSQPVRIYIVVLSWYYDNSHESHASAEVKEIRGRTSTHLQLCSYGLCSRPTRDVWCRTECGSNSPPLPRAVGIISFGYSYLSRFPSLQLMGGVNIPLSFSRPFL
jgi:hypothetical protein